MSEQTKKFLKVIGIGLVGVFIGMFIEANAQLDKPVPSPQVVTKEVPTTVTVTKDPDDYAKLKNNLPICTQELLLSGQVNTIAGDVFQNLNYYMANPSAINEKAVEVRSIVAQMQALNGQIMQ